MDDLFQYLIYGIIIISFLSSFLKKKEPSKQTPLPRSQQPDLISYRQKSTRVEPEVAVKKSEDYDILRELENLFKGEVNVPQQKNPQTQQSREYIEHEIGDENLDKVSDARMQQNIEERRASDSKIKTERRSPVDQSKWSRKKSNSDPKIEASAKAFERVLAGPRKQRAAITEFNRKLKNPANIKEYILISEILGKPKALRR